MAVLQLFQLFHGELLLFGEPADFLSAQIKLPAGMQVLFIGPLHFLEILRFPLLPFQFPVCPADILLLAVHPVFQFRQFLRNPPDVLIRTADLPLQFFQKLSVGSIIFPVHRLVFHLLLAFKILPVFLLANPDGFLLPQDLLFLFQNQPAQLFLIQKLFVEQDIKADAAEAADIPLLLRLFIFQIFPQDDRDREGGADISPVPGQLIQLLPGQNQTVRQKGMAADQLLVLLLRISVLFQPFHPVHDMDSQSGQLCLQLLGQLQYLSLCQPLVFLLQNILLFFQVPPEIGNLQKLSPGSMENFFRVKDILLLQIQIFQDHPAGL